MVVYRNIPPDASTYLQGSYWIFRCIATKLSVNIGMEDVYKMWLSLSRPNKTAPRIKVISVLLFDGQILWNHLSHKLPKCVVSDYSGRM